MKKNFMTAGPITPAPGREGYFEITYKLVGKPGVPYTNTDTICLLSTGYQEASAAFAKLDLGELFQVCEVSKGAFQDWLVNDCTREPRRKAEAP